MIWFVCFQGLFAQTPFVDSSNLKLDRIIGMPSVLTFETIPGVGYQLESSNDLNLWAVEGELYGMGQRQKWPSSGEVMVTTEGGEPRPAGFRPTTLMVNRVLGFPNRILIRWLSPSGDEGTTINHGDHEHSISEDGAVIIDLSLSEVWGTALPHSTHQLDGRVYLMHYLEPSELPDDVSSPTPHRGTRGTRQGLCRAPR